ncbi:MAG: UDP-3-O-[3-hydroxymyristoyl] N-acetylglucosamine deacetylase [Acidocella sp. 20-57-95]|nr:MAG: UDP-3-O-[3-hydroxymyristoyl] N-acetylglucosamine deacetylase [Acidocella sp. 20-57-95]OYV59255.1 MAG: UDP-3-O-[3-hydroxymyristoyl] N-acetylglucosamine deacetylase [Acidocella sp. 21-58-7]HQT63372.1 UDP-3-O-acyl-N-acetylglucosamine deacetylase [Acidocella sp.]HQU03224.1 UDP-3-O-acyl-N-acetylglucosamine deacetylase [Acidocella sp.]
MSYFGDRVGFGGEASSSRRTLKSAIGCVGIGLHSGNDVHLNLRPAPVNTGIVFHRTDIDAIIPALYDHVTDTRLCTVISLADRPQARVGTIEHLMAALSASRIDDLIIEVDAAELPILDGSAAPFLFLIESAGIASHGGLRDIIEVLQPVRVEQGEAFAELRPHQNATYPASGLDLSLAIDFAAGAIGRQAFNLGLTTESFANELARARTFTMAAEVEALRKMGLARGGSLANAIVVDGDKVLNPEGLRWQDEFVRHKLLDVVGDLALAGAPLCGRFRGNRTGHALNNQVLRALFADSANYRITRTQFAGAPMLMPAAAAPV